LVTAGLSPDPLATGLQSAVSGLTRTTVLLKMLRFGDDALPDPGMSVTDFLGIAGQVLGGQAMPAISVELPAPALPGTRIPVEQLSGGGGLNSLAGLTIAEDVPPSATLPAQPRLGPDPTSSDKDKLDDVLAGVPGIVGVIESGLESPPPLRVSLDWTFTILETQQSASVTQSGLSALGVLPPLLFVDLGADRIFTMRISVTGTITVPNPADPSNPLASASLPKALSVTAQFPGIALPRLLGLFTWPHYGGQPAEGRTDPTQDSLLVLLPADSPLTGAASIVNAVQAVQQTLGPVTSLVTAPLSPTTVTPFATPLAIADQIGALLAGLTAVANALAKTSTDSDYRPVMTGKATAPSPSSSTRGGLGDITTSQYWWHYYAAGGHDTYHDNAQSFLWLAPPGGQVVIYRDTGFQWGEGDVDQHGRLTLTTGSTCVAGIADFRPSPSTIDTTLSPTVAGLTVATSALDGWFTNEHPPTSESNWAWTDSVEFL
jgi:hypothetical protein